MPAESSPFLQLQNTNRMPKSFYVWFQITKINRWCIFSRRTIWCQNNWNPMNSIVQFFHWNLVGKMQNRWYFVLPSLACLSFVGSLPRTRTTDSNSSSIFANVDLSDAFFSHIYRELASSSGWAVESRTALWVHFEHLVRFAPKWQSVLLFNLFGLRLIVILLFYVSRCGFFCALVVQICLTEAPYRSHKKLYV